MKKLMLLFFANCLLVMAGTSINLDAPAAGDLVAEKLVTQTTKNMVERNAPREAIAMSWGLDPAQAIKNPANITTSKEFWMQVDGTQFNEGVSLNVGDRGAMVRISPMSQGEKAPSLADLVFVNHEGRSFSEGTGIKMLLDPEQVEAAKATPFGAGTAVFQMDERLGNGEILLFADNMDYKATAKYLVHVRENQSDVVLRAETNRFSYLAGQTLKVDAQMLVGDKSVNSDRMEGELIAPSGERFPLTFKNGSATTLLHDGTQHAAQGLWSVRVTAVADDKGALVRRDLRTSFAVTEATARFSGEVVPSIDAAGFKADLTVEAGVAGRYEVRGILMGTDEAGALQPLAMGHSAVWLEAGEGDITLSYDAHLIEESGLQAPFKVQDLRLIHQNRMGLVQHQRNGFTFPMN